MPSYYIPNQPDSEGCIEITSASGAVLVTPEQLDHIAARHSPLVARMGEALIKFLDNFRQGENEAQMEAYRAAAAVYAELLNITDPVKVGISDLENPNKRDGHYRPRGRYKHPDALAVEADAEAATREMNELIDRYEAGEPLLDLVLNAQERQTMCDDALTYIHLLAEDDNCGCRPDRASECLFCRMKARYQEWLRRRNANQEA